MGLKALKSLEKAFAEDRKEFLCDAGGVQVKMHLLSGIEAALIRHRFEQGKDWDANERSAENLLYIIHEVDGDPLVATEMNDEVKDEARSMLLSLPQVLLNYMYHSYLQKEMDLDNVVGVSQLRNLIATTVLAQLAKTIDFPVLLTDLMREVMGNPTPNEIMDAMERYRDKYVEATSQVVDEGGDQAEGEKPSEEYDGVPVDPTQITGEDRERGPVAEIAKEETEERSAPATSRVARSEDEMEAMRTAALIATKRPAEEKMSDNLRRKPKRPKKKK